MKPRILDPSKAVDGGPAFAPNGTLAMKAQRGGETGIWIRRPGQALRELIRAPSGGYLDAPSFSPDGSRLAIPTGSAQGFSIHIVDLNGADRGSAAFGGSQIGLATWSADGASVIFPGRDGQGWRLWRVRVAQPGKLTPVAGPGWLSVRARGGELYGVKADSPGVWRIDGTPRRVTPLPTPAYSNQWTIVGDAIDYVDDPFGDPPHVLSQPIAGGKPKVVAAAPRFAYDDGFAVDPKTGAVVYAAARSDDTDLELLRLKRG